MLKLVPAAGNHSNGACGAAGPMIGVRLQESTRRPPWRRGWPYLVAAVILGLAAAVLFVIRGLSAYGRPNPEFPSLVETPDPSLVGTVAYTEVGGSCVRVVAAAGGPSRDVLCFEGNEGEGPQLAFLADGRLEVTMFDWPPEQPIRGAWQKIVDITTGAVEETPAAQVPDTPTQAAQPTAGPNGERIVATSDGGRITIVLEGPAGSQTLLSAEGNPDYRLATPPVWSPDGRWILAQEADEGRLLLVTVAEPPQTRVLVDHPASFISSGVVGFAVSGSSLP